MMPFPAGITVTVNSKTVSGTDSLGNDVFTVTPTTVTGCAFDPGASTEDVQGHDLIIRLPILFVPHGTVIKATDQVVIAGQTYDVDGVPSDMMNPFTGWTPGIAVQLQQVTG